MSRYELVINGQPFTVEIREISGNEASVLVNGVNYRVQLPAGAVQPPVSALSGTPAPRPAAPQPQQPERAQARPAAAAPPAGASVAPVAGELVPAPMPGKILAVLVQVGDRISDGDTVVVMEAMKMENEIKSHVSGTVLQINVSKGQSVSVGDALVTIGV